MSAGTPSLAIRFANLHVLVSSVAISDPALNSCRPLVGVLALLGYSMDTQMSPQDYHPHTSAFALIGAVVYALLTFRYSLGLYRPELQDKWSSLMFLVFFM